MRFAQAGAVILTAALLAISNQQAHAVPDFRDGWVDQGGKWHPFVPNNGGGQPLGGPNGDGGTAGVGGSAGAGDSGGTTSTGLGLNTIFNDLPSDDGPHGGSQDSFDNGSAGTGGTQSGDAGGSSLTPGGSHFNVPEPGTIALLGGALLAAGAANRRRRAK